MSNFNNRNRKAQPRTNNNFYNHNGYGYNNNNTNNTNYNKHNRHMENRMNFIEKQINFIDQKIEFSNQKYETAMHKINELSYDLYAMTETQKMLADKFELFETTLVNKLNKLEKSMKMVNKKIGNKKSNINASNKYGKLLFDNEHFSEQTHIPNPNDLIILGNTIHPDTDNEKGIQSGNTGDLIMDVYHGTTDNTSSNPFDTFIGNILNIPQLKLKNNTQPKHKENNIENEQSESEYESESEDEQPQQSDEINHEINHEIKVQNIHDLIKLGLLYKKVKTRNKKKKINKSDSDVSKNKKKVKSFKVDGVKYNIDLRTLYKLNKPLKKLSHMVGLESAKQTVMKLILYYIQDFGEKDNNILHSCIEGPPGVGKTEFGKILGEIYVALGVIKSKKFKKVTRSDLVGEYLGHTAPKTKTVFEEGVLFIDEAYALGNEEKRDSYAKECIDTINENLTENKNIVCIIAGYPKELDKCFFAYNPGLGRRFKFRFQIKGYETEELKKIFINKINDAKWSLDDINDDFLNNFFKEHKDVFNFFGGDMDNLFTSCKFSHSHRVFGKKLDLRTKLTKEDLEDAIIEFKLNKRCDDEEKPDKPPSTMYC